MMRCKANLCKSGRLPCQAPEICDPQPDPALLDAQDTGMADSEPYEPGVLGSMIATGLFAVAVVGALVFTAARCSP